MPARGFGVEQVAVSCMRSLPAVSKGGVRPQWPKIRANTAAPAPLRGLRTCLPCHPAPVRFAPGLAGTVAGPGPPVPALGSAAVNPAAQPATNLREAVLDRTLRFLVLDHDTFVRYWPVSSLLLYKDKNPILARNLLILRRLFQTTLGFLTDRQRCCKP
jgi:hypothetical protein